MKLSIIFEPAIEYVTRFYDEEHRFYHNMDHINNMFNYIGFDKINVNWELGFAILFHDAFYKPGYSANEEASCKLFLEYIGDKDFSQEFCDKVMELIMATKNTTPWELDDELEKLIVEADMAILASEQSELFEYENKIFEEFQCFSVEEYRKGRIDFLNKVKFQYMNYSQSVMDNCQLLIDYVGSKKYKVGIYAGSFNPFHIGHEDICQQAEKIFDKIIVARGYNREKNRSKYVKLETHREAIDYEGMLIDLFQDVENVEYTLVRGLRTSFDVGYEDDLRNTLRDFKDIPITYFFCKKGMEHVSSSMIRSLYGFGEEMYERYLP